MLWNTKLILDDNVQSTPASQNFYYVNWTQRRVMTRLFLETYDQIIFEMLKLGLDIQPFSPKNSKEMITIAPSLSIFIKLSNMIWNSYINIIYFIIVKLNSSSILTWLIKLKLFFFNFEITDTQNLAQCVLANFCLFPCSAAIITSGISFN